MKTDRTLILIADGGRAAFFRHEKMARHLVALVDHSLELDSAKSHEMGDARPGRVHSSMGHHRSGMEPRSDPHDAAESGFLTIAVHKATQVMTAEKADKLVIAASPRALGEIRKLLPDALSKQVLATLDKDLTRTPIADLPGHFKDILQFPA